LGNVAAKQLAFGGSVGADGLKLPMLKRPLWNTIVQILGKVVMVGISLITTSWLTRKLGVSVYGNYILITSVFVFLDSLADFGSRIIGVREMSQEDGEEKKGKMWNQIVWMRLLTTLVAFVVGLVVIGIYGGFKDVQTEAFLALVMIFFTSIAGSLEVVWQVKLKMEAKVLVEMLFPLLFLIGLSRWSADINLVLVFGGYLAARIITLGLGVVLVKKEIKIEKWEGIKKSTVIKLLKETWPMGVYLLVFTSYDRAVDSIMIQRFVGIREVAWYGLAYKIYSTLLQPAYFFVSSIFPLLSGNNVNKRKLFKISLGLLGATLVISIPILYVLAPTMVTILAGQGYEATVNVLRVLLAAMIFAYVNHLIGFSLISKNGQKEMLVLGMTSLLVNILGNLYAIPRYGIMGAAVVTVLTEAWSCLVVGRALWKKTG